MSEDRNNNDLSLAPNEFAFVQDTTNGRVQTYTGPFNASLNKTDRTVLFDKNRKEFVPVHMEDSSQIMHVAPEGWYIQLKNPSAEGKHPTSGEKATMPELNIGRKINISGPVTFASWPGQMVRIIQGHHLRENEYLLVRVYDEDSAKENWTSQLVKTRSESEDNTAIASKIPDDLSVGKLYVIKGTEVSFYMPTTGMEVVAENPSEIRSYVRDAVTLERLEFCILLDQDGNKRYVQGPAVVFPSPTEQFVERSEGRKFKAFELNINSGLYVKVIAPYSENGKDYEVGDELFITGKDTPIYFPREEHALVKYGERDIHYGVMIPSGEGRYVASRSNGEIRLEKGPSVFLPDPREDIIIRRILDPKICNFMYPKNNEALNHNANLISEQILNKNPNGPTAGLASLDSMEADALYITGSSAAFASSGQGNMPGTRKSALRRANRGMSGDEISRGQNYTPPRSIVLDSKYEGAVCINVWEGYALMLIRKGEKQERRVVIGPATAMLEYDEIPHVISFSSGKPKTTGNLNSTVYLKVTNNPVTDIISAETKDYCNVQLTLSYRVNFDGDDLTKWFAIENYVKFLCDHMRSVVRNHIKKLGIEEFYQNSTDIIRDLILGKKDENGRVGRHFDENSMTVSDVEVLTVDLDSSIQKMLKEEQRDVISLNLSLKKSQRDLEYTKEVENCKLLKSQLLTNGANQAEALHQEIISKKTETEVLRQETAALIAELQEKLVNIERQSLKSTSDNNCEIQKSQDTLSESRVKVQVEATKSQAQAISPALIEALRGASQDEVMKSVANAIGPMRFMEVAGGKSIKDILSGIFQGTGLDERLEQVLSKSLSSYSKSQSISPAE